MNEKLASIVGKKLELIRASQKKSKRELSILTGIDRAALTRILLGQQKNITLETIDRISKALECEIKIESK